MQRKRLRDDKRKPNLLTLGSLLVLLLLGLSGSFNPALATQGDFREFDRSAFILPEGEVEKIRQQVLRRCALSKKVALDKLPWYFHYEFGIELLTAGDPQRALDSLLLAANHREDSKRNSRMYGMWFTNYLPYYQIAKAHTRLGNWRCAMDAMRVSAQYSEFNPGQRGYQEYSDLQQMIIRQNQQPNTPSPQLPGS